MKSRITAAIVIAALASLPGLGSGHVARAQVYCYPGDPPDVYQACLAYNAGIQQQVSNLQQLQNIQSKIGNVQNEINALYALIANINKQIDQQKALIQQTQDKIAEIDRQIRFKQAELTRLQADTAVRDQLLDQRLRYVDGHGAINYVQLVLTSSSFDDLMNRLTSVQEIASSDRKLLDVLQTNHTQIDADQAQLGIQRGQVSALLLQQQAEEKDLENNKTTQQKAIVLAGQLEQQLQAQFQQLEQQKEAIDAQVASLARQYDAAAIKAGGGSGVFEWPEPNCGFGCISQGFGCTTYAFEIYDPACPYPHRIHTGIDIAGPYGTPVVAADTGVVYLQQWISGGQYWGYGIEVYMIHGNGYATVYGHLSRYAPGLQSGMIVARGTVIAYEGSTGWSTGPHLHFEVRYNDVYKDPCIWLGC